MNWVIYIFCLSDFILFFHFLLGTLVTANLPIKIISIEEPIEEPIANLPIKKLAKFSKFLIVLFEFKTKGSFKNICHFSAKIWQEQLMLQTPTKCYQVLFLSFIEVGNFGLFNASVIMWYKIGEFSVWINYKNWRVMFEMWHNMKNWGILSYD